MKCPCGSGNTFEVCCQPIIAGEKIARSAEELLRARYSAFTQGQIDFIENTHDPKTRKSFERKSTEQWAKSTTWLGLEVINLSQPNEDTTLIEFKAYFEEEGEKRDHHELSLFSLKNGNWYFTDGKNPNVQQAVREDKPGRNDPCSCGSGKKYKKCCG